MHHVRDITDYRPEKQENNPHFSGRTYYGPQHHTADN